MATHLDDGPLDAQLKALGSSALDFCRERLEGADASQAADLSLRVHDVRRKLKWLRSTLRILRPRLTDGAFRQQDHALRDVGRELAEARALTARTLCLASLADHFGLPRSSFDVALPSFDDNPEARKTACDSALIRLTTIRDDAQKDLPSLDPEALVLGVENQLRRAKKAFRRAQRAPSSHHLHEWRKEVKYHLHQIELLRSLVPELAERAAALKILSELLGHAHDLADVRQHLATPSSAKAAQLDVAALLAAREAELSLRALTQGRELFRLKRTALRTMLDRRFSP